MELKIGLKVLVRSARFPNRACYKGEILAIDRNECEVAIYREGYGHPDIFIVPFDLISPLEESHENCK